MDYFFERDADISIKQSLIITEDEVNYRVGINNKDPQYSLDVNSNIRTCNLYCSNVAVAEQLDAETITASNVVASNLTATQFLQGLSINAESNLCWGGHSLNEPYPQDQSDWDDLIPFDPDMEGMIHQSWLYKPLTAKDVLSDLWNLAETGIDVAELLADLSGFMTGTASNALLDAVQAALDGLDEGGSNQQLLVSWSNLKHRPIANDGFNVGVKGDLLLSDAQSIKVLPSTAYTTDAYGTLQVDNNAPQLILNAGTKELFINSVDIGDSNICINSNIFNLWNSNVYMSASNKEFRIHDWLFTSNVISNSNSPLSSIQFSTSNNVIGVAGDVSLRNQLRVYDLVNCDRYVSDSNGEIYYQTSNLKIKFTMRENSNVAGTAKQSYVYVWNDTLEYKTQESESNYGGVAPQVLQMSVDSNGALYVRSNVIMPSTAVVRAFQYADLDNPYREGILRMTTDTLRFVNMSNVNGSNREYVLWSVNSNGMFLNEKFSVYGKAEAGYSNNFARVDATLQDGFVYGTGLGDTITSTDLFRIDNKAQIYTFNHSTGLEEMLLNSNAEIVKGGLKVGVDGAVSWNGSNMLKEGSIIRRANEEEATGFKVSPNGYLTMGGFGINPYGVVSSACNITTTGTITCSNIVACNLKDFESTYAPSNAFSNLVYDFIALFDSYTSNVEGYESWYAHSNTLSNTHYILQELLVDYDSNLDRIDGSLLGLESNVGWCSNALGALYDDYESNIARIDSNIDVLDSNLTALTLTSCNFALSAQLSNYSVVGHNHDSAYRQKGVSIPWQEVSGKPDFSASNDSLSIGGCVLGAAGLAIGAASLFNSQGQLAGALASATGATSINPSGYSTLDEGLTVGDYIDLSPVGEISAETANFLKAVIANEVIAGNHSIHLSNDMAIWRNSNQSSNMMLGSNNLTVYNGQPFVLSNEEFQFTCNIRVMNSIVCSNISACNISGLADYIPVAEKSNFAVSNLTIQTKTNSYGNVLVYRGEYTQPTSTTYPLEVVSTTGQNAVRIKSGDSSDNSIGHIVICPDGKTSSTSITFDGQTTCNLRFKSGNNSKDVFVMTPSNCYALGVHACNFREGATDLGVKYALSNTLSNFASTNQLSNYAAVGHNHDGTYRKVVDTVAWADVSGKPSFSVSNDSLSLGNTILSAAGLTLGAAALLNGNGELTAELKNVANTLSFDPVNSVINAVKGNFSYAKIGDASIHLSNNQIIFSSNTTSNMVLGSNSLVVHNALPYTFSNSNAFLFETDNGVVARLVNSSNIKEAGVDLGVKYSLSNSQSNYALLTSYTTYSNYITPKLEWTSNNNLGYSNYITNSLSASNSTIKLYSGSNNSNMDALVFSTNSNGALKYLSVFGQPKTMALGGLTINSSIIGDHFTMASAGGANFFYNFIYGSNGWTKAIDTDGGWAIVGFPAGTMQVKMGGSNSASPHPYFCLNSNGVCGINTGYSYASNDAYGYSNIWLDLRGNMVASNVFATNINWASNTASYASNNASGNFVNMSATGTATVSNLYVSGGGKMYMNASNYGYFTEDWGWKWQSASNSHNFKIVSGSLILGSNVGGTAIGSKLAIAGNDTMEFGLGVSGKGTNSGKIGYATFTANTLDIVGAGADTNPATRAVKIWDNLWVADTVYPGTVGSATHQYTVKFKNDSSGLNWGNSYTIIKDDGNVKYSTDDYHYWQVNGVEKMFLSSTKWTTQGFAEINGTKNMGLNTFGYLNASGQTGYANQYSSADYSLDCPYGRIRCTEFNANSDAREKTDIEDLQPNVCCDVIKQLQPKGYVKTTENLYKWGFIAQEVETVLPQAVSSIQHKQWNDYRVLDYNQVFTCSVGAIKGLLARVEALEEKISKCKCCI